jgi:hypothetical protein
MKERANNVFPFAIGCILPPAGLVLGVAALEDDRDLGIRLIVVSLIALVIWVALVLSLS